MTITTIFSTAIIGILVVVILARPYLGIAFTITSLPLIDLFPQVPFLSSSVILIGAATVIGFLLQKRRSQEKLLFNFGSVHILGLLFIVWVFISNPQAAWYSSADRNWVLTFLQLWILVWLTSELLDSPAKQHSFMWIFSIGSAIAAIIAIQQGYIGETVSISARAIGLAGNPNATGRYLVVAMMFFSYLSSVTKKRFSRLLATGGVVLTFIGVFFTVSRTSIILLIIAVGLQNIISVRRQSSVSLVITYMVAALLLGTLSDQVIGILQSIMPSIQNSTDTIGLRYKLWQAAWQMWQSSPIMGIGIGRYSDLIDYYAPSVTWVYPGIRAHNTYLTVLAETGLIGSVIFLFFVITSIKNFWQSVRTGSDTQSADLRNVWLNVFLVVLIGEITYNGITDKLLWFLMGISVHFRNQTTLSTSAITPVITPKNDLRKPVRRAWR